MSRLSFIILLIFTSTYCWGQSPHGVNLKIDCAQCHNPGGWEVSYETIKFDHNDTNFELEATHTTLDCKACHADLIFEEAPNDCMSCHVDVHSASVGNDCVRCHTSENWLVFDIPEIHEENGFPLIGAHSNLSCVECHSNESSLIFTRLGNECIECHRDEYLATQNPNHISVGFSQDCIECHSPFGFGWDASGIIHDFFPLTQGHDIADCSACHNINNFGDISSDCFACHMDDYANTNNPNHASAGFPTDCIQCHTTNPGWMPATIDHDFFPLTLGHDINDCSACHNVNNFSDVSSDCYACHMDDYAGTTNPNHMDAGFSTDCIECHTTDPGWMPATLNHDFFPLTQGHNITDCSACHNVNNYSDISADCFACHEDDYNGATDPNHLGAGFPTDCAQCHTTNPGWMPANFDHDGMYFPIYSGRHDNEWTSCTQCHQNPNDYSIFTCLTCHDKGETNMEHEGVGGYIYESNACLACHPDGDG